MYHVLVQALPGRLTFYLIGQADSRGRFEGLLHIKRFTRGYNHFAAGYTQAQLFEVILGISYKTLSNYVNHIADAPLDNAFFAGKWAAGELRLWRTQGYLH